jgi:hypothetical protein
MPRAKGLATQGEGSTKGPQEAMDQTTKEGGELTKSPEISAITQALKSPEVISAFQAMLVPSLHKYVTDTVHAAIAPINEKMEAIQIDVNMKHDQVNREIGEIQKKQSDIQSKISSIERKTKQCNLIMHGVPVIVDDSKSMEENLTASILEIIKVANILGVTNNDIEGVMKITPAGQPPFLLVSMKSILLRRKLFAQRTKLKICKARVYFNEDLTKEEAALHKKARKQVKDGTLHSCWTAEGLVYGKSSPDGKPFQIKDL